MRSGSTKPALHGRDHCPGGADPIPCWPTGGTIGAVALGQQFSMSLTSGVLTQVTLNGSFWSSDTSIFDTPTLTTADHIIRLKSTGNWVASLKTEGYSGTITELSGYLATPTQATIQDAINTATVVLPETASGTKQVGGWALGFFHYGGSPMSFTAYFKQSSGFTRTISTVSLFVQMVGVPGDVTQVW